MKSSHQSMLIILFCCNCISRKSPKSPKPLDRVKKPRVWELGGDNRDMPSLDFSTDKDAVVNDIAPDTAVYTLLLFLFIFLYKSCVLRRQLIFM